MDMQKQTEMVLAEIVLAWELSEQGVSKAAITRRLGCHGQTIISCSFRS